MNGDVEEDAPRPRPLSAGIWTLFSWLRRTDRSSSSESVTSVGSDRTVASFDFLAPLNYKNKAPLVLSQGPLTDSYKKRVHERNLRRHHDRDLTLRRKYGLFTEEGLGYDAFSLPSAHRLQKDTGTVQNRARRATSESIQRRSAYVPGKRRAPLPPTVIISATLPRGYTRKRPAPKPPVKLPEENKENVQINKCIQMKPASDTCKETFLGKDIIPENKTENHSKHETKEIKLRTDKSFLKQIFDNRKRNSAIDTSRVKFLPNISELDKQAAEIIQANKSLHTNFIDSGSKLDSNSYKEEMWICTTCLRKYNSVVKCCIYCVIKENSSNNNTKVSNMSANTLNTCTQTQQDVLKSNRKSEIEDKKKLREMLKEMKDSLPKRTKHNTKNHEENRNNVITSIETPTLRIGSNMDQDVEINFNNVKYIDSHSENEPNPLDRTKSAKETFLLSQPSSSKQFPINYVDEAPKYRKSSFASYSTNLNDSGSLNNNSFKNVLTSTVVVLSEKECRDTSKTVLLANNLEMNSANKVEQTKDLVNRGKVSDKIHRSSDLASKNKLESPSGNKMSNAIINHKKTNVQLNMNIANPGNTPTVDIEENVSNVLFPTKCNASSFVKVGISSEKSLKIESSKILPGNQTIVSPIQKGDGTESGITDKTELIHLGNVFSPKSISIGQRESSDNSNSSRKIDLHTPLKISSLLNPLYSPKHKTTSDKVSNFLVNNVKTEESNMHTNNSEEISQKEQTILSNIALLTTSLSEATPSTSQTQKQDINPIEILKDKSDRSTVVTVDDTKSETDENASSKIIKINDTGSHKILDHHGIRRNLINQLEQAISKGDEQLAAEAAAKLAKLKLSCSVLSFSSQIVAETRNKKEFLKDNITNKNSSRKNQNSLSNVIKVETNVQQEKSSSKHDTRNQNGDQKPRSSTHKEINIFTEPTTSSTMVDHEIIQIEVWVEDKEAARGPIPLRIPRIATIGELKRQVEKSLGLKIRLQRWIVGKTLCTDDTAQLVVLAGPGLNVPFYVCLVESDPINDNLPNIKDSPHTQNTTVPSINKVESGDVYVELMKLEQQAIVPNTEEFDCGVCIERCAVGAGAVLRECIHTFCRECLADVIRHCEEPVVACPAIECPGAIQEREIRALLSLEEYERWLARGLAAVESGTRNTFHCRTRDCKGWAFCEPGVRRFPCPVCKHTNCVPCQAVHEYETCEQYQIKLRDAVSAAESNQSDEGTQALLKSLISRGEALECPECSAIITKKWGCDWVKCSACKTEICWVTKGRRWGPGGKGDTSGGCRCGIDGKRCHPSCGYCH